MREDRREHWAKTIAEHEASGMAVQTFCQERGICAASFYAWRRRLRTRTEPVRFARIEAKPAACAAAPLELIFTSGERLRIFKDADVATLRLVLSVVRA